MADEDDSDRPTTLIGGSAEAEPEPPTRSRLLQTRGAAPAGTPGPPPHLQTQLPTTVSLGDDPLVSSIMATTSFEELTEALKDVDKWEYADELSTGVSRAKTYVQGSDKQVLTAFSVSSINEWKMYQKRILVVSRTAFYRVAYNPKKGQIDHYHMTKLSGIRVFEKTLTGLKIFLTEQDGNTSVAKKLGSWFGKKQEKDEFEHVREYLPAVPTAGPAVDLLVDVMAATLHKAAELCSKATSPPFTVTVLTTESKKSILADRKEAARLEAERIEKEVQQRS